MSILSSFCRHVLGYTAVALLLIVTSAFGATVTFTTEGSWDGGLTFAPTVSTTSDSGFTTLTYRAGINSIDTPSVVTFGTIDTDSTATDLDELDGLMLIIRIFQTEPEDAQGDLIGQITGMIRADQSLASIQFTPNIQTLSPDVQYSIGHLSNGSFDLVPPVSIPGGTTPGTTSLQGFVDVEGPPPIPEPSAYALMGAGLLGLALIRRGRKA